MVITTSLFDLNRKNWTNYDRPIEHYRRYAKNMTSLVCDMVIYTTEDLLSFFENCRKIADPDPRLKNPNIQNQQNLPIQK